MKFILPLLIILLGAAGGGAAGYFLSPEPVEPDSDCVCEEAIDVGEHDEAHAEDEPMEDYEYVNIKNQFVVPIIEDEAMAGMVVMSLSLEVSPGTREAVFAREPKLRDEFLRILFGYATIGGFGGNYLEANDLKIVREDLTKVAQNVLGPIVNEVLIVDMIRQDL